MARRLADVVPNVESPLALRPEELAALILEILNNDPSWGFDPSGLFHELLEGLSPTGERQAVQVPEAVAEAINWLESQGFLAVRPIPANREILFVTRRGRDLPASQDAAAFRNSTLLPANLLHPLIAQRAHAAFIRGEYDTAVLTAFIAVEVAVRKASGLPNDLIGTRLMSVAFHPSGGPLVAAGANTAESEAVRNLFAGAIGHGKNPHSHRDDPVQPEDACQLLMFASYLLRIVDSRAADKALE
jgi:uncharacterized protein (TIGR02391 family)